MTVRFECPVCGSWMNRTGTMRNRKVQTWTCGSPSAAHEVTLRLRGNAMITEKKPE